MPGKSGYGGIGKNAGKGPGRTKSRGKGSKPGKAPMQSFGTSRVTTFEGSVPKVAKHRRMMGARGKV